MTKLMAQDGNHFLRLTLFNQSVVDDNVLLPRQSVKVGIAVSTPPATVNHVEIVKREIQLLSQTLETRLDLPVRKRREFIEQRQDHDGINGDGKDLDENAEQPQIEEERVPSLLHDLEHGTDDRRSQNHPENLALEHIRNPQLNGLLVEPEFLFQNEGAIVRNRQRENSANNVEHKDKNQCLRDLALKPPGKVSRQHLTAERPQLGQGITIDEEQVLDLTDKASDEAKFCFGTSIGLKMMLDNCRSQFSGHFFLLAARLVTVNQTYLALVENLLRYLAL